MSRSIKGLLIKDFKLMKAQMKFFIIIMIVWGIFMSSNFSISFFIGYMAVLFSFLTMSTMNYDEFEKGMAYIFTLPILRKDYIKEKYVFGFMIVALPTVFAACLSYVVAMIKGMDTDLMEYLLSVVASLGAGYLLLAFEIPLQIKFGQEKSRIVSAISVGLMVGVMGAVGKVNELQGIDSTEISSSIAGIGEEVLVLLAVLIVVVLLCISYKVSCKFMEKKQF